LPESPLGNETGPTQTVIVGGGPAGLCAAISLARRGWSNIEVWEELPEPPGPDRVDLWGDPSRSYNLGLGGRGQTSLAALGAWKAVSDRCARVAGRFDWPAGAAEGQVTEAVGRNYPTMVIQRDRLTAVLLEELRSKYPAVSIQHGVECMGIQEQDGTTCLLKRWQGKEASIEVEFVVAADGVNSTLTKNMSSMAPENFQVTRLAPNLERELVYKTLGLDKDKLPKTWRTDLNYSSRQGEDLSKSITFEALPTREGNIVAVVLFNPTDTRLTSEARTADDVREQLTKLFPQFAPCVNDRELESFAQRNPSRLPSFAYAGPSLHVSASSATIVALGDSIHSVKPYFGLGVNSAFEDVICLKDSLDKAGPRWTTAAEIYSAERGKEAEALVTLSASFDGNFFQFVLPLILDGIFSNLFPQVFAVNSIRMLQSEEFTFTQVVARKLQDRILQAIAIFLVLAALISVLGFLASALSLMRSA